ncbi:RusA family crossover junction endodeoxyribonuclease [Paraburkholderia tagetis]|uniref:RusA family crossover junction endodeoxyribonuclease n=1 Tax=Paraburkholderia tagetis TaxID=2913261 RepID=A0A9X1RJH9_9BURK|nr:RusA family crossover junction endodeoxyribonuclease [Paraburkholderia tagetis]MCG5072255.1 RusA family crossover junction endodeoxyribonuclease [Paraburkholderia tagetis]
MTTISFVILGEPASKANSRKLVTIAGRPSTIKSDKAHNFEAMALPQIPPRVRVQLKCPLRVTLRIFYASERPDLDESVVLDVMQDRYKTVGKGDAKRRELVQRGVYVNDRQVREKHVFHAIDRANPRTEVTIEPLASLTHQPNLDLEIA